MEMLIYAIICVLCYTNEWNLITNSHNATMRSIKNIMVYKKKIFTTNFDHERIRNFKSLDLSYHYMPDTSSIF